MAFKAAPRLGARAHYDVLRRHVKLAHTARASGMLRAMAKSDKSIRVTVYAPAEETQRLHDDIVRRKAASTGYTPESKEVWREALIRGLKAMREDLPSLTPRRRAQD